MSFREVLTRGDALGIAVGVATGIAVFYLVSGVVFDLIGPLIAIFVGNSQFELNSFSIQGSEFRYGGVIGNLIAFLLIAAVGYFVMTVGGDDDGQAESTDVRPCPECTRRVPAAAKRCPYCTSPLPAAES